MMGKKKEENSTYLWIWIDTWLGNGMVRDGKYGSGVLAVYQEENWLGACTDGVCSCFFVFGRANLVKQGRP